MQVLDPKHPEAPITRFSEVRALIFDLDGTLIDSEALIVETVTGGNAVYQA